MGATHELQTNNTLCVCVCVCVCVCTLHIVMFEPLLMCTLCVSSVKVQVTFSISMYIMCVMFVWSFEPWDRHFTNVQ